MTGIGCQSDDVGQVIFLFRIFVGNPPEEIEQQRHPSRHDAAVAKADRAFLVGGVAVLDNAGDAACIITHNAAVAGRICRLERGNGQRRAVFNGSRERGDAFGSDKGGVRKHDHGNPLFAFDGVTRCGNCIARAELLFLNGKGGAVQPRLYAFGSWRKYGDDAFCASRCRGVD